MTKEIVNNIIEKEYFGDLKRIKETIRQNQNKAMVIVNSAMISTYYEIGTIINKRKTWGSKYIKKLSNDLEEYGNSYSTRNIEFMSQFANSFSKDEFTKHAVSEIPWGSIITIMQKSHSHKEMLYYINETHKNGWSRSMVLNQIALKSYERSMIKPETTDIMKSDDLTNELFKDTYVFDFLDKEKIKNEKDLKNQMIDSVIKFIQELGSGFSLVAKEYVLKTPPDDDYRIDILMYHTKVHAYIVIEVKIGKLKPIDIGQLIFYVNAVDDIERTEKDEETVGLLLCKDADNYVTKTCLKKINMKLGVSKYKFMDELPEYLERRLKEENQ